MPSGNIIVTQTLSLDTVNWKTLTAPINCNNIVVQNNDTNAINRRTDSTDPNTQRELGAGGQDTFNGLSFPAYRFAAGSVIGVSYRATVGAPTITVDYMA